MKKITKVSQRSLYIFWSTSDTYKVTDVMKNIAGGFWSQAAFIRSQWKTFKLQEWNSSSCSDDDNSNKL